MGYFLALFTAFCFALNYVFMRKGMRLTSDNGVLITLLVNLVVLTVVFIISQIIRPTIMDISWQAVLYFSVAGLFTLGLGRLTLMASMRSLGSNRAVAIKNGAPVFTVITAILF